MTIRKRYLILPFFFIIIILLLVSTYKEVESRVIEDFNRQQMALAKQASYAIEELFNQFSDDLSLLANSESVANFDKVGEKQLSNYQKLKSRYITGVTRVDAQMRIVYTFPERPDLIGRDISSQDHVKEVFSTHQKTLSEVFEAVQGYKAIAFHVPVYANGEFDGSLALLISFDRLAENFLKNINIANNGYAWVISKEGQELFCPIPGHNGNLVQTTSKEFPSILRMAERMMMGEEGFTTYNYQEINPKTTKEITKHAAFCPIPLFNTMWSIVVATPEEDVLASMKGYRDKWLILLFIFVGGIGIYSYVVSRALEAIYQVNRQKEIEEVLRENERNLRSFVTNSPVPIAFNDPESGFLLLNYAFTYLTGYSESDIPNLKDWFSKYLTTELDRYEAFSNLDQSLSGNANPKFDAKQVKIVCKNNRVKTFEYRYIRLASRHILTLNDISDKLDAEYHKKKLEEQLARSKKMEALGLLAGGVAHDLNNILSGIVTYPELILMNLPEQSPLRKPVNSIMGAGKRAAAVVQDLLTLARGVAYKGTTFSPNKILSDMREEIRDLIPEFKTRNISITWEMDPKTPNLRGSEHHLRKTLSNLILNAGEALDVSGEILVASYPVTLSARRDGYETIPPGDYCVLKIKDNGPGIEKADLERIFEPFFTKKVMGRSGSGLGLMVVWNTVKEFEGFIDIETGKQGTQFLLYLPVSSGEPIPEPAPEEGSELFKGEGRSILIVDDDAGQREISMALLQQLGFTAEAVSTGSEAVDLVKKKDFDLLLLDMVLEGGMFGDEIFRQVVKFKPSQRAIIVSGFSTSTSVKETLDLGAQSFLKKPYTIKELRSALQTAFSA